MKSMSGFGGGVASLSMKSAGAGGGGGIVTDNLVLHLDVGNSNSYSGSGTTWTDLSGQGNHATLVNGPTYSSNNGGYLSFDGSNDHATLPAIDLTGNEITFSIWTQTIANNNASAMIFFGDSGASGGSGRILGVFLPYAGNNYYYDKGWDGNAYDRLSSNSTLQNSHWQNVWVNWTFTANASTGSMKIYRNASLFDSGTGYTKTFTNANGDMRTIAKFPTQGGHYEGYISNLQLYKKELSASEVTQNFDAMKTRFYSIITNNLVLHLDAGNSNSYSGSGTTWSDLSGSSNDGTLTNGVTYSSDNGGVLVFDGTDDYVVTGSDMFNANADFTFSMWFNSDDFSVQKAFIADVGNNAALFLRYNSGIQLVSSNTGILGYFSSSTLSTNTWYNITLTRSSTTYTLYINGSSVSTVTTSNSFAHSPTTIGANNNNSPPPAHKNAFDGKIAQVFAYNTALSDSDVQQNFDATRVRYGI